ncbi:MAG: hypothetical protein U0T73_13620 [Chitinophagales bacterium]
MPADFTTSFKPIYQALVSLLIGWIAIGVAHVAVPAQGYEFAGALVALVLFGIANAFGSVFHPKFQTYTLPSWGLFLLLLIVLLLSARAASGSSIRKYHEYILSVGSICAFYFVVSILVRVIRALWEFAEADENT